MLNERWKDRCMAFTVKKGQPRDVGQMLFSFISDYSYKAKDDRLYGPGFFGGTLRNGLPDPVVLDSEEPVIISFFCSNPDSE